MGLVINALLIAPGYINPTQGKLQQYDTLRTNPIPAEPKIELTA